METRERKERWHKDDQWEGNPGLGVDSYTKRFANYLANNRMVPVTIFGKGEEWNFCVRAGANSEFSYAAFCVNCRTIREAKAYVEQRYEDRRLFF